MMSDKENSVAPVVSKIYVSGTALYRALIPMACCELVKVNLTIIIIQRITHTFDCAFEKSNV